MKRKASSAQREIWLAQSLRPEQSFNLGGYSDIRGTIHHYLLQRAVTLLVQENDALRIRFSSHNGELFASVQDHITLEVPFEDLRGSSSPYDDALSAMRSDMDRPVPAESDALSRIALFQIEDNRFFWYVRHHHIAVDALSCSLLVSRTKQIYAALARGEHPSVGKKRWQSLVEAEENYRASSRFSRDREFWRNEVRRCASSMPVAIADYLKAAAASRFVGSISPNTFDASIMAKHIGVSENDIWVAAMSILFYVTSGDTDLQFSLPVIGRSKAAFSIPGMTANILPLRIRIEPGRQLAEEIRAVHRKINIALRHQHYRGEDIRRDAGIIAPRWFGPTVNVMYFDYGEPFPGCEMPYVTLSHDATYDFEIKIYRRSPSGPYELDLEDGAMADKPREFAGRFDLLVDILKQLKADPNQRLEDLRRKYLAKEMTSRAGFIGIEAARVTNRWPSGWKAAQADYPADACLHRLFERQARQHPHALAIVGDNESLTYQELNLRANRLAHQIISVGVRPDELVALCAQRSPALIVGLLAILKAGAAYLPLDAALPPERLAWLMRDARPAALLHDAAGRAALRQISLEQGRHEPHSASIALPLDKPGLPWPRQSQDNPDIDGPRPDHLAYVLYTSGSTGAPKGVMVEHRSLTNLMFALREKVLSECPTPGRLSLNAGSSFDASLQCLAALTAGHGIVIVPQRVRANASELLQYIDTQGIHVLDCTPTQLNLLCQAGLLRNTPCSLRILLIGGEAIDSLLWQRLAQASELKAYNLYGLTECAVDTTVAEIGPNTAPAIGSPLPNTSVYLLDELQQPVPHGAVGELYIGGVGVARGYLHQPELTARRFLPDPFCRQSGARMYRTGDLARYRDNGDLEFLGRNDEQLKIRGYRIEPGEIQACLAEHPAVQQCAVIARDDDAGNKQLTAYVVVHENPRSMVSDPPLDDELPVLLRDFLARSLPDYMLPAAFVRLHSLPLTANGKLDRRALPAPGELDRVRRLHEPPAGALEQALAEIWAELLGLQRVGRHDNFFELGGTSLAAAQLISRIQDRLDVEIQLSTVFEFPRLAAFTRKVGIASLRQRVDDVTKLQQLIQE